MENNARPITHKEHEILHLASRRSSKVIHPGRLAEVPEEVETGENFKDQCLFAAIVMLEVIKSEDVFKDRPEMVADIDLIIQKATEALE